MEGTPKDIDIQALRRSLEALAGVSAVHDLHVWALTSGVNGMSAHVIVPTGDTDGAVLALVQECARDRFKITHSTIQIEPNGYEVRETRTRTA